MNQSAFLNQLESSKLNQKYHIAIQSNAVPIMPGQRRNRTTKAAAGLDSKDLVPADPKAMRLAMMTPTRENAATAQAKYVRFAAAETTHFRRCAILPNASSEDTCNRSRPFRARCPANGSFRSPATRWRAAAQPHAPRVAANPALKIQPESPAAPNRAPQPSEDQP